MWHVLNAHKCVTVGERIHGFKGKVWPLVRVVTIQGGLNSKLASADIFSSQRGETLAPLLPQIYGGSDI